VVRNRSLLNFEREAICPRLDNFIGPPDENIEKKIEKHFEGGMKTKRVKHSLLK
jgi:hypothetical protein